MQNKNKRSITYDLIENNNQDHAMFYKGGLMKNKKPYKLKLELKPLKDEISSTQFGEIVENEDFKKIDELDRDSKKKYQTNNKTSLKLPIIYKNRSKSSQVQTYLQPYSNSDAEIMDNSKQDKISMRPIFKSINQILSKHQQKTNQPKNNTEFENDKISNDQSILKQFSLVLRLSQFLSQNQNDNINIGKYVQEKIEQKRINNFRQLYKNAVKYQSDEEENGCILSSKELQQVEHIKNRRKVILKMAQRKSPKFLYPLGPKIRVPNFSLENQYFQIQQNLTSRAQGGQLSPKKKKTYNFEDDISIQKLDSPPKDKCFPTSSMQEDYLNIKIQQIVKSFL
ncbi:unnamed protein product (macronuclear) [Paramecium tetraurelia]|uniref:Uncharacterized protein n=1 Tax=Paramecium tetraurelia TaxID=5888 RepID=A0C9K1_PARTE|nr:uncharacterized protein GSPATT00006774001 [Paramecium tetraurelia]CAK67468.1 unnamed protein product [Paramecium tetraurelia]|eukprot:XP_001434865.1 hypothetical protein (macronuclear) [Paramecium tetraurelia strain d4-2]